MPVKAASNNPWEQFYRASPMGQALDLNSRNSYLSVALHPETWSHYNQLPDAKSVVDAFNPLSMPQVRDPVGTAQATVELWTALAQSATRIWTG